MEVAKFSYPIDASRYFKGNDPPSTLFLWYVFTDADGNEHHLDMFVAGEGTAINQILPNSKSTTIDYQFEQGDYPQPLTFKITSYPKDVLDYQELKLK